MQIIFKDVVSVNNVWKFIKIYIKDCLGNIEKSHQKHIMKQYDLFIFCHQDISFYQIDIDMVPNMLKRAESILDIFKPSSSVSINS